MVEVGVTSLRAELKHWVGRVRRGEEVVVTEHGVPVARLVAVDSTPTLERLVEQGVITGPLVPGRKKAQSRRRVRAKGSVSEYVSRHRG